MIYKTENIINFRDLGGHKCAGGITAYGNIFRCGIPKDPTESDLAFLREKGIGTVIDLRGYGEAREMPSFFKDSAEFVYHNISLLEANPALAKRTNPLWEMYISALENYAEGFAKVFRIIGETPGPLVFHCFLGKDRSGMLAALLLGSAGVDREEILSDYEISFENLIGFVRREIEADSGLIWEQDISRLRSDRENMERMLDFLDEKYSGINGYLRSTGLTDDEIGLAAGKLIPGKEIR
jgi:protein tyrosine/serine phosphatase